ncbi:MAG: chromate transporter [Clostridia bacterium]|nr:chromate transporter [Clostridia bacterium]
MILFRLFASFFQIGLFSFGGGMAMLPWIYQVACDFGAMSKNEFANLVGIAQVTPGPVAVNSATYVGFTVEGVLGALSATLGVALPSFILVAIVAGFLKKNMEKPLVKGAFKGIRPVTVGLIGSAEVTVAEAALWSGGFSIADTNWLGLGFCIGTLILMYKTKLGPIKIMLGCGALGAILYGFGIV